MAIINNCSFHRNIASATGGVFVSLIQSHTQLMSSEFNGNRAVRAGGVGMAELQCNVFIIDSSGFNNTSQLGGAVYVTDGCLMYVERCQVNGCIKVSSLERLDASGDAFAVTDSSELVIKDGEFYNNTALFSGGVAFLSTQSYAYINNTQFSFNLALRVGGIDFNGPVNDSIMNCIFSHNSGTNNGGAINIT